MRLTDAFAAESKLRPKFIPYVMAGDPNLATTEAVVRALARNGATAIELGIPYGDPLADGPTIAAAGARALAAGVTIEDVLALVARLAPEISASIVLFTYFNPLDRYGLERFARDAAGAGAAAVIVPDIALEESEELRAIFARHGIDVPMLVAPSTPPERAVKIAAASTGFLYIVSRLGVTGAASEPDFAPMRRQVVALRAATDLPLALGFGVSRSEHVRAIADDVDAAIVGSAFIDALAGL
ncbi:MAG: tryptophan synthase subunit alpha, partial [Candidatus Eremiobacteraeota bacterium]|nr:tryptophan synthase subunit alpha [Candidatus Eremiobacteraeota bacterium]